ncbi:MAG: PAS domain-containing protein [Candidatus Hydrogenedentes bacterium]|nr:PAS domain-containing protein [Candidatus Hydrogenedentota bacterium]
MAAEKTARALAEVIDRDAAEFARAILERLDSEQARATEAALLEWLRSIAALLRGDSGHTYEYVARIVAWARARGVTAETLVAEVHRHRRWLLDFCCARIKDAAVSEVYDVVLQVEREYVQQLTRFCEQADREVLAAARRREATIMEVLGGPCLMLDAEGHISLANTACANLMGMRQETLTGLAIEAWCVPETAREFRRALRQRRAAGPQAFTGTLRSSKGTPLPCRFTFHPMFDDQGLRCGLAVGITDLAEPSSFPLVHRLSLFDDLAEVLGIGFQLIDLNGEVLFTSNFARKLMDDHSDLPPAYCHALLNGAQDAEAPPAWISVMQSGRTLRDVVPYRREDGERWIEVVVAPQRTPSNTVSRIISILRDVTRYRTLERSFIEHQQTSLASQLAVTVAHQLRNPLSIVIGFAEMLATGMTPEKTADAVGRLLSNGLRCKRIVDDLLEFGQGLKGETVPTNLVALIRESIQPLYVNSSRCRFRWSYPQQPCFVLAVPEQLSQICTNLVEHAIHVGASEVAVTVEASGDSVRVAMCDNGPEIPESTRERLFEPFISARGEGAAAELGLSLARYLAQEHGGRLFLENSGKPGTCFVFEMPLFHGPHETAGVDPDSGKAGTARRVIIVDDELDLLELLRTALERHGYIIETAATSAEALSLISRSACDGLVIDIQLPGELNGQHLYRFLSGAHPDLAARVLFITADTMTYETRKFLEESGRPHMEKPFLVSDFVARVQDLFLPAPEPAGRDGRR